MRTALDSWMRPYLDRPFSVQAKLRAFLFIQAVGLSLLLLLLGFGVVTGSLARAGVAFGFVAVELLLLALVRWGWGVTAVSIFLVVLPALLLLQFVVAPITANPLALDYLLTLALINLTLAVLISQRPVILVATAAVYLAVGLTWALTVQQPLLAGPALDELNAAVLPRFPLFLAIGTSVLAFVQTISTRANRLAESTQAVLAERVAAQAKELEETLDRLRAADARLHEADKLSTVGRLVAGVAHEVNTPLAAIGSSAGHLDRSLPSLPPLVGRVLAVLEPPLQALLLEVLKELRPLGTGAPTAREVRERRKALVKAAAARGEPLPDPWLDALAELGYDEVPAGWTPLLRSPEQEGILALLSQYADLRKSVAIIGLSSAKAGQYVKDLRSFVGRGRSDEDLRPVSVVENLESFLYLYQNVIKKGIQIVRRFGPEEPQVLGRPSRLMQVWSNLISNAVAAMHGHGLLILEVLSQEDTVTVVIEDSGPGISDEVKSRIFEPFFSTKTEGEGMGLGLQIVRGIVEEHAGTISFDSEPGRTRFIVVLPRHVQRGNSTVRPVRADS